MVDAVLAAAGSGTKEHVPWPANYEKNETGNYVADTSKIEAITAWKPRTKLVEGVQKTVEYYLQNRSHYWA